MDLKGSRWASASKYTSRSSYQQPRASPTKAPVSSANTATTQISTGNGQSDASAADPAAQARAERADEFARHRRLLRRLRWKLPGLATSHRLATAVDTLHPHYAGLSDEAELAAARQEAELMFKLDWFEYYALLERALLHLLGVWGIRVRGSRRDDVVEPQEQTPDDRSIIGARVHASPHGHRFHANVLASLDAPQNPLHATLGRGEVRRQLGAAKRLRNLWKAADEQAETTTTTPPLQGYDMERMLLAIFGGFEGAYEAARRAVEQDSHVAMDIEVEPVPLEEKRRARDDDEDGDLIMEDAMDWED